MTKTRKPPHDRQRLDTQYVTTSGFGEKPDKPFRPILKKSATPSADPKKKIVTWDTKDYEIKVSLNDRIIRNKPQAEEGKREQASSVSDKSPPSECMQEIDVQPVPAAQKSVSSLWEEQGRWMIFEMRPNVRSLLLQRLSHLYLAVQEAEIAHGNGCGTRARVEETHAALKTYVYGTLTEALNQQENIQYWTSEIGKFMQAISVEHEYLGDLAVHAFNISDQIKQMRQDRIHSFHTWRIGKIIKSAIKFQDSESAKGRNTFKEKVEALKAINAQLDAELQECQAQQSFEKQARCYIEELVQLESEPAKKNLVRESYEYSLKQLSTSEEMFAYIESLKNLIRQHPMTGIKKQIDKLVGMESDERKKPTVRFQREAELKKILTHEAMIEHIAYLQGEIDKKARQKKSGHAKRWFDMFCPQSPASDASPSSSARDSSKDVVQIVRRKPVAG